MNEKNAAKIPAKWLVVIIFALVAYGLGQPMANRMFGLKLPALASLLGYQDSAKADKIRPAEPDKSSNRSRANTTTKQPADAVQAESDSTSVATGVGAAEKPRDTAAKKSNSVKPQVGKDNDLLYGLLVETGNEDYISPAGLRFTRGSEEGHRLKHLARHLQDQPDRPGRHGVFNGDMAHVLKLLDEAYRRALSGEKGTSRREDEDGDTVFEVNFSKPIGYLGGREGAEKKNPECKRVRMVVNDNRLITAFPF
jgi:hypothetical protein